jgi:hypothetical protein
MELLLLSPRGTTEGAKEEGYSQQVVGRPKLIVKGNRGLLKEKGCISSRFLHKTNFNRFLSLLELNVSCCKGLEN